MAENAIEIFHQPNKQIHAYAWGKKQFGQLLSYQTKLIRKEQNSLKVL